LQTDNAVLDTVLQMSFITEFSYANKNKTHSDVPTGLFFLATLLQWQSATWALCQVAKFTCSMTDMVCPSMEFPKLAG